MPQKHEVAGNSAESRVETSDKGKTKRAMSSVPVRISGESWGKLEALLVRANKNREGRRVKAGDVICFSLGLVTDEHLAQIGEKMLSNRDRMEMLFKSMAKTRRGLSRDEFLGILLNGNVRERS